MLVVTLKPIKGQQVNVDLDGQSATLKITQTTAGLFMDIGLDNLWIAQGIPCLNCNKLVRYKHLGFRGELFFADTVGDLDPSYDGLGGRFKLFYATEQEMAA
ncbi:Uncharacterised protein [Cedecea lapagei]|uniref:Cyanophage baseplate Pam3 plug gp18 domain-containing protein n=1 Tax=Cedecea lapagei TaxID=158823 RepID=A0A447V5P0_9ENTR|nr:hypothetical protein [Cedecea lapagei]VEB99928.1 Uncharacterised protein [Cedecea lapagei]